MVGAYSTSQFYLYLLLKVNVQHMIFKHFTLKSKYCKADFFLLATIFILRSSLVVANQAYCMRHCFKFEAVVQCKQS